MEAEIIAGIFLLIGIFIGKFSDFGIEKYKHSNKMKEIEKEKEAKKALHPMLKRYLENPEYYGIEVEEEN